MRALIVAIAVGLWGCEKVVTYEPSPEKRQQDIDNQGLKDAKTLAEKNDLSGAHQKLAQIGIDSPSRRTGEFTEIEDRWADAQIAKADAEPDMTKKLVLLEEVSKASSVSGALRAKASNKVALATPDPSIPPILRNYDPVLAAENMTKCRALQKDGKLGECKAILITRVFAGIASPEEADTLSALCLTQKDRACGLGLEDAGVLKPGMYDQVIKGAPPAGSCSLCGGAAPKK